VLADQVERREVRPPHCLDVRICHLDQIGQVHDERHVPTVERAVLHGFSIRPAAERGKDPAGQSRLLGVHGALGELLVGHGYTFSPEFNRIIVFEEGRPHVCSFREMESLAASKST
jgi:hypothetical protein